MTFRAGIWSCLLLAALAACDTYDDTTGGPTSGPSGTSLAPSQASTDLSLYYNKVQADLLARGLMRTDGGGPDTPFTPAMLSRNFERIAFYDEYTSGTGLQQRNTGPAGQLRRWADPVKINIEFGPSVSETQRDIDRDTLAALVPRLANATGHSIRQSRSNANFHVLVMRVDDQATLDARIRELTPGATAATRALFTNIPRNIHCLVAAFASGSDANTYTSAIAVVRAEHPDLLRKSCLHEEISQGLGLANDSPQARPSIFNDDDEFALLTTHDELLLSMLYDPRLSIGMSVDEARPVLHTLAREKTGNNF